MAFDIKDPETRAAVDAMIDEAVTGLKAKNIDLAARLEKAKKGKEIDPDEHAKLEQRAAELEEEVTTLKKTNKTLTTDFEKTKKAHESESEFTKRMLVDNGLVSALTAAGVTNPVSLKAAKAMLKDGVTLVVDGEVRKAMLGDKPLAEAITVWAGSDEGKHFVTAQQHSGGGAQGGSDGKPSGDIMKMTPTQRMEAGRKK